MNKTPIIGLALALGGAAACDRTESAAPAPSAAAVAPAAPADSAVEGPTAAAQPASAATKGTCPVGRYRYDYKDQFLESLSKNTSGARVVKESGTFVCTITDAKQGTYRCEVSEGGVENVFEANTAGGKMVVAVKLTGSSDVKYESAGEGRWKTTTGDLSGLEMEVTTTLGGKTIPMPPFNPFKGMDKGGTILEWKCEGDMLLLKPIVDGMSSDYAHLKPL